jgi:AraC-like DNA-binding protein
MHYSEYRPAPALAPFVRVLWTLEHDGPGLPADRIFPDGCMEVVFHLGQPFSALDASGRATVQPSAFLVGQMTSALQVQPSARARVVGIRFQPGGAFPFLQVPQQELTNALPPLEDVWPALARERDRLAALPDMRSVVSRIEEVLARCAAGAPRPDRRVAASASAIAASAGAVTVDRLSAICGLGARQLERLFRERVGLGPKRLARIVRFQAGLRAQETGASLTAAAHAAGYADQAHFAREFRALAGVSPSAFASAEDRLAGAFAGGSGHVGFVQATEAPGA